MQFSELKTEVFRRLDESEASPKYFLEADIEASINEGLQEIADITAFYETSRTLSKTASTYYNLETLSGWGDFLHVTRIFNVQTNRWLEPTSWRELDQSEVSEWQDVRGEPESWFMRGLWHLGTFPHLSTASGTMAVYYAARPTDLSADADTPGFPAEFHPALIDYAMYDLLCQKGETKKGLRYYQRFVEGAEKLRQYRAHRVSLARVGVLGG